MKRTTTALACAAILGVACLGGPAAQAADHAKIQPGKWELTISTQMDGQEPMAPAVFTKCQQAVDLQSPEAMMARAQRNGKCQIADLKTASDKMSWTFSCSNGAKGQGAMTYSGATYESTMHITVERPKGTVKMTQHIKGKRLGDC